MASTFWRQIRHERDRDRAAISPPIMLKWRIPERIASWRRPKGEQGLHRLFFAFGLVLILCAGARAEPKHAIAMHGEPAYPAGFRHFPYADPNAPKGGRLTLASVGSFDSVNPLVVRGNAFQDVRRYVIESLMARGADEPFALYPLLAETVETDAERTYVTFRLDPRARFSDGKPVTADDVLFSWRLLRDKGRPNYRAYYGKVARAEKVGERGVRFTFGEERDRELPLILGLMPVLAKHAIDAEHFDEPGLKPLLGSGPYTVAEVRPGESVTYSANTDGLTLPVGTYSATGNQSTAAAYGRSYFTVC